MQMLRQNFWSLWTHKSGVRRLKLLMFHAVIAALSKRQLLSFSINYRYLHHGFGCVTDSFWTVDGNSYSKADKFWESWRQGLDTLPRHIRSLEVLKVCSTRSHRDRDEWFMLNHNNKQRVSWDGSITAVAHERNRIIQANWTQWLVTENLALFCKITKRFF